MLEIKRTNQFKKDFKQSQKRGKNIQRLKDVLELLVKQEPLPPKYRPHKLTGDMAGYMECHIEPDWLFVYRVEDGIL